MQMGESRLRRLSPMSCSRSAGISLLAALSFLAMGAAHEPWLAQAATFHAHDGASLQSAVAAADSRPGPDTIELSAGSYTPEATLTLTGQITLAGPATSPGVKLDGGAVQPFPSDLVVVESHAVVSIHDLELTTAGGPGAGAAIDDFGTLDLESSTLAGNNGPGLLVEPGAEATVRNSTLSDGLDFGLVDLGRVGLFSVTVAGNAGGGIENANGTLAITNTIVAGNRGSDCTAPAHSSDHSLDGDGSCGVGALGHVDPLLMPLAFNGGSTQTSALSPGSPAIGASDPDACPSEDQRHFLRPSDHCDIGAYQADATMRDAGSIPEWQEAKSSGSSSSGELGQHHPAGVCPPARSRRHASRRRRGARRHRGRSAHRARRAARRRPISQERCVSKRRVGKKRLGKAGSRRLDLSTHA
jgi:hypothetical protein